MILSDWSEFPVHENLRTADLEHMGENRAPGLHLSAILRDMKVAAGENVGAVPGDQEWVRPQVGFLWESALEYMAGGLNVHEAMDLAFKRYMIDVKSDVATQLRLEKDGIHMTPDGVDKAKGELYSYKATYRSFKGARDDFESKYWTWIAQEASYAYAVGVDTVHWVVLFLAGDYTYPIRPMCLQRTAVFTAEDLARNWAMILANAEPLREESGDG